MKKFCRNLREYATKKNCENKWKLCHEQMRRMCQTPNKQYGKYA